MLAPKLCQQLMAFDLDRKLSMVEYSDQSYQQVRRSDLITELEVVREIRKEVYNK